MKVPRAMMYAVVLNTVMALGFLITLLFCIGDVDAAINTPTGFPTIQIIYQATGSKAGATIIECMILLSTMIALFGVFASVSRLTWAFAKDNGLPYSEFFSRVSHSSICLSLAPVRMAEQTYHAQHCQVQRPLMLTHSSPGPPDTPYPTQRTRSSDHHLSPARSDQH